MQEEVTGNMVYLLMKAAKLMRNKLDKALSVYDITAAQFAVMNLVGRQNGLITSAEIAGLLSADKPTISGMIRRLEQKDLIQRRCDPRDRRAEFLSLNDKALDLLAVITKETNRIGNEMVNCLPEEQRSVFGSALLHIIGQFDKEG